MYDFEVYGQYVLHVIARVFSLAYKLRFRKIVSYELTGEYPCDVFVPECKHYRGMLLRFADDGASCHVSTEDHAAINLVRVGVLKHDDPSVWGYGSLRPEFARLAAVYWVAFQQSWKDLAEVIVP